MKVKLYSLDQLSALHNFAFIFESPLPNDACMYVVQGGGGGSNAYSTRYAAFYYWENGILVPERGQPTKINHASVLTLLAAHWPPIPNYFWTPDGWQKQWPGEGIKGTIICVEEE